MCNTSEYNHSLFVPFKMGIRLVFMLLYKSLFESKWEGSGIRKKTKNRGIKDKWWERGLVFFVLQHKGCLHNVPVYRIVLTARRIMARRTSFSCVEWRKEAFVLNTRWPQFPVTLRRVQISRNMWAWRGSCPFTRTQQTLLHTFLFARHECLPLRNRHSCSCLLDLCTSARRELQPKNAEESKELFSGY